MRYLLTAICLLLAACAEPKPVVVATVQLIAPDPFPSALPSAVPSISPSVLPTVSPTPSPSPSPSPSASPASCLPLKRVWSTATTPNNQLMGVYIGPPTNGPVYKLDLSGLATTMNFEVKYDATHTCYYDVTAQNDRYLVNHANGCNLGILAPGQDQNAQCDYCPYPTNPGVTYEVTLTCNTLTVHNSYDDQTISYY